MKRKITKKQYEDLPEELQKSYKEVGDNYVLQLDDVDVDDLEDRVEKMDSKLAELLDEKKKEKQKREAAEEEARTAKLKKDGDVEALEQSWQEKLDRAVAEKDSEIEGLQAGLVNLTSGAEAIRLATALALPGSADVLKPHIEGRLKTEFVDGKPKLVILDKDGKPSAMTAEDLETEFRGNETFSKIIKGSEAGGAGHEPKPGETGFKKGDMGGDKASRVDAIRNRFPDLDKAG